ncbi:MAG: 1-deoxy-D-xylulose-5-phosphate synthase [Chloroflexota bacterium]
MKYKYLNNINLPEDLRKYPVSELPAISEEVRDYMIDVITRVGGHFGAGLGVVELTVALHYVFNTPADKLIFDVGHQGYPHKILTGRKDQLHTIRKKGGLSGFLKPSESEYDAFGAGHASTSISAALGMAAARDLLGEDYSVVSIIGDGSMTGGLAYEALNNAGVQKRNVIVILNDNNISIDPNVSAFSNYFNELFASQTVQTLRNKIWDAAGKFETIGDRIRLFASRLEDGVKAIITPGALFEVLGFKYFGPINGHNVPKLVRMLRLIKEIQGPIFLHVITQKGKGYLPAEEDSHKLHAIGTIDKLTGKSTVIENDSAKPPRYDQALGGAMLELCEKDDKIVGITAAMGEGTGLDALQEKYSDRLFDVGIAEGHAVTFASGLAMQGVKPVVAIYSTFLQRAYDNIMHDCCLQKLPIVFAIDRAGLVGSDGPTHHGTLDLCYLRSLPGMTVMAPRHEQELRDMLYSALNFYKEGPSAIRYPKGRGIGVPIGEMKYIPQGKGEILREGTDIALVGIGTMTNQCLKAAELLEAEGISAEVVNARFVKPLDEELFADLAKRHKIILTIEDGQLQGGFGSAVLESLSALGIEIPKIVMMGIPDKFIEHGLQAELHSELGLDAAGIIKIIKETLRETVLTMSNL